MKVVCVTHDYNGPWSSELKNNYYETKIYLIILISTRIFLLYKSPCSFLP